MALLYYCHHGSQLTEMQREVTKMQRGGHMQNTEMKRVEGKLDDDNSGNAEFPGVKRNGGYRSAINLCFLMFSCLIFESSVDRGIPSFAAAPSGPATFPLLSAKAASMISFS
jgi:hypothetical protein